MKLKIEVVKEERTVESFAYLQGMHYTGDENYLEYENVKVGVWKGHVVVRRSALLRNWALGNTENHQYTLSMLF